MKKNMGMLFLKIVEKIVLTIKLVKTKILVISNVQIRFYSYMEKKRSPLKYLGCIPNKMAQLRIINNIK